MRFTRSSELFLFFLFFAFFAFNSAPGRAQAALLIEQPYGFFGTVNPTGHNALYFERICAETPVKLRRCAPGELGAVLSRYQGIGEYDWVAIPLIPYLYSVEDASAVPTRVNPLAVNRMRNHYHEAHLMGLGENLSEGNLIHGGWTQLIGVAYERRIYAFRFQTTEAQDDALIARLNSVPNRSHFSLLFNNCGDFARKILNTYFPRAFRRSIFPDAGITTPKQVAFKLAQYARKHPEAQLTVYEIPQIPGYRRQSRSNKNINESLMTTLYAVPIAMINPYLAGGLFVDYFARGRNHILPTHPQLLMPNDLKDWSQIALTASTPAAQNPVNVVAQVPDAPDTRSKEIPQSGGTNSGLREIEATNE